LHLTLRATRPARIFLLMAVIQLCETRREKDG
jgi:hypothetical protein